jgi:cytoskeleton protein RodZ
VDPTTPVAPSSPGEDTEPPIPELRRLGEQLARARRSAGWSEEDLAGRLRLAPRQLKALEEGNHTNLPEGVFVVALARRVAGVLNADVEDAIQAVRQSRLMRRAPGVRPEPPAAPEKPTPVASEPLPPAPTAPTAPAPAADATAAGAPLAFAPPAPKPVASAPGKHRSWRWLLAVLVAAGVSGGAWLLISRPSPRGVSKVSPAPTSTPPAPVAPVAGDTLRLSASEPSWVEVRDGTGRTLFEGTLTGEKRFPIGRGIAVISGRPHAVRAAVGTGVSVPLGGVSEIRWKRFSPGDQPSPPASSVPSP